MSDGAVPPPATIRDALGTPHRRCDDRGTLRIVSLVPSLTELLCDLGLASSIVGRTGWCVHPAGVVDGIARIGGTKTVNAARIRRLAPTHLVVNVDENEKPTVDALAAFVPHVVVTHPATPRDNVELYRLFGHVFGCEAEADALVARFESAWRELAASARREPAAAARAVPDLERPVDDDRARHVHRGDARVDRLAGRSMSRRRSMRPRRRRRAIRRSTSPVRRKVSTASCCRRNRIASATSTSRRSPGSRRACSSSTASCCRGTAAARSPRWRTSRRCARRDADPRRARGASARGRGSSRGPATSQHVAREVLALRQLVEPLVDVGRVDHAPSGRRARSPRTTAPRAAAPSPCTAAARRCSRCAR